METSLTFYGTNTLVLRRGDSTLLIDPHFTRPSLWQLTRKIEPDRRKIADVLSILRLGHLDGVLLTHTHYDHALDAAEVIRQAGGMLFGSESACRLAHSACLNSNQYSQVTVSQHLNIGDFRIIIHPSRHLPFPIPMRWLSADGQPINHPINLPAYFWEYASGEVFAIQVDNTLIFGSAGFKPGAYRDLKVDHVVLAVGGLGMRPIAYLETLYQEVVAASGARQVLLSHWDNFFRPLQPPLITLGRSAKTIQRIQRLGIKYNYSTNVLAYGKQIIQ